MNFVFAICEKLLYFILEGREKYKENPNPRYHEGANQFIATSINSNSTTFFTVFAYMSSLKVYQILWHFNNQQIVSLENCFHAEFGRDPSLKEPRCLMENEACGAVTPPKRYLHNLFATWNATTHYSPQHFSPQPRSRSYVY